MFHIGIAKTGEMHLHRRRSNRPGNSQAPGPSAKFELWKVGLSGLRPRCKRQTIQGWRDSLRQMTEGALEIAATRGGVP